MYYFDLNFRDKFNKFIAKIMSMIQKMLGTIDYPC